MRQLLKGRGEALMAAGVITLVLMGLMVLIPTLAQRFRAPSVAATPSASTSAPPEAILLPDELHKALDGVMTITDGQSFGTAFEIDTEGDFLTASTLIDGAPSLRLIDNTGGMHQVRVLGIDRALGAAMLRVGADGTPLTLSDQSMVNVNDSVVLLASPKVESLNPSSPGVVTHAGGEHWSIRVDALPGNMGGPIVGPGAKVLGILVNAGTVLPIASIQSDIQAWAAGPGTLLPLAPFPPALSLRGSETTTTPGSGAAVVSVNPSRASAGQSVVVSVQGSGFVSGAALAVEFLPLSGSHGAFTGQTPTVVNPATVTVKVPAGEVVQDYVIELINGDGTTIASRIAFTITP